MSHRKQGLRAFGLTLVIALGLMAFLAVSAQANWLYLESSAAKELMVKEEVKVSTHKEAVLLYLGNGGKTVEVKCAKIAGEDILLVPGTATEATATGKISFETCHTFADGDADSNCDPTNAPITAGFKATVILHTDGKNYILFSPETGDVFTEIKFDPAKCTLTSTNKVKGSLVAECGLLNGSNEFSRDDCGEHMTFHLLQQAPAALFADAIKFGNKPARLDGIAKVELAGIRTGLSWGGTV